MISGYSKRKNTEKDFYFLLNVKLNGFKNKLCGFSAAKRVSKLKHKSTLFNESVLRIRGSVWKTDCERFIKRATWRLKMNENQILRGHVITEDGCLQGGHTVFRHFLQCKQETVKSFREVFLKHGETLSYRGSTSHWTLLETRCVCACLFTSVIVCVCVSFLCVSSVCETFQALDRVLIRRCSLRPRASCRAVPRHPAGRSV